MIPFKMLRKRIKIIIFLVVVFLLIIKEKKKIRKPKRFDKLKFKKMPAEGIRHEDKNIIENCLNQFSDKQIERLKKWEEEDPLLLNFRGRKKEGNCKYNSFFGDLLSFDPHMNFEILISPEPCEKKTKIVLFGIKSLPKNWRRREAIRKTWLEKKYWIKEGIEIKIVFILGLPSENELEDLELEVEEHDDLLVLNFTESHYHLPFKDVAFMNYFTENCAFVDFVFKGDDDIVLNPFLFGKIIKSLKTDEGMGCYGYPEITVRRPDTKYFMPGELFPNSTYPPFFAGAASVVGREFLLKTIEEIKNVPPVPIDDVWMGMLMKKAGLNSKMINNEDISKGLFLFHEDKLPTFEEMESLPVVHGFNDGKWMERFFEKFVLRR